MYLIPALLLFLATSLFAQQPTINVDEQLAPFRQYYETREDWPRSHGWKPFKRYEYDVIQRAFPGNTIPAGARWEGWLQMQRMPRASLDENWVNLGPFNHGGRTRVLRFYPNAPDTMFAGSVGGGLFRSDDAGSNWYPFTDALPNLAIGSFEISPSNPNIMYLGTGEGYFNGDGISGVGLLKSIDGGQTWQTTGLSYEYSSGTAILRISVDPRNADIVLASTNDGLYRSTDGGANFTRVRTGNINELKRDPQHPDTLLCAAGYPYGSALNGVYRSTDNGATWFSSSTGLPNPTVIGRIVLSYYPNNSLIVYAGVSGDFDFNGSQMIGVYQSIDNGVTWTRMSQDGEDSHYASQGWYDMAIAVDPDDPSVVFNAGLDVYRSVNNGETWSQKTWWYHGFGDSDFSHADHHELVFHPTHTNELWDVNDGGIFVSYDNGNTWNEKNTGYCTYQYYAMGNATLDTAFALGGSQDNGTSEFDGDGEFDMVFGGDGGFCVIDYSDDDTYYVEYQNGNRYRTDNHGGSFHEINPGITGSGPWVTPIVQDPFEPNTIYTTTSSGGSGVWMSPNQGRNSSWLNLGSVGSANQALSASPAMPGRLYLGTNSNVMRFDVADQQWVNVTGNLSGSYTTRVTPDPFDPNTVYVAKSGYSNGHVWKSVQGGTVWTDITGNLPNVPFQDVVVDQSDPLILYAGGDLGVYRTVNGGATWEIFGEGLPVVRVDDMELQAQTGMLRIATHGRGMWEVPTGTPGFTQLFPNGTEVLGVGSTITIRWSGVSVGGNVRLELSREYPDGTWETIASDIPNSGTHSWTVTGPATDHARFRVTHMTQPELSDTSNADTRIVNPALNLLSHQDGSTVLTGTNDTIRFERVLAEGLLTIELNLDYPSGPWEVLTNNLSTQEIYVWRVRQPGGDRCRLRITSNDDPSLTDMSETDFVVRAPVMTLLTPDGGEVLRVGEPYEVTWSAAEYPGGFRVLLNRSYPDGSWELVSPGTENDGSFEWTPNGQSTMNARLRLATTLDPVGTYMESSADFTIDANTAAGEDFLPTVFYVSDAYPNPFNPTTRFTMEVPARTYVLARVMNQLGQTVSTLVDGPRDAGRHTLTFDGGALASGLYFLRVEADNVVITRKLTLLK
ncbi:MAG: T9SS type A sorting domain-containing protein [Calditrichaeota bacterium]|nr:T9SS type A sorting domain-containing protein [Calditrichota bacterium]MCB9369369.1 T9SS type A sorting domain-containing protein [Calditrichota bacterium]